SASAGARTADATAHALSLAFSSSVSPVSSTSGTDAGRATSSNPGTRTAISRALSRLAVASTSRINASRSPGARRLGQRLDLEVEALAEPRSEEHTSELQSRGHLVCRLLLEKKKKPLKTKRAYRGSASVNSVVHLHV